ncbi:hypothetical protein COCSUDRAFT_58156 [Coccomyxa subellipsoidea C-169]|uniref:Uncharacterized protein n=1 Tax=Coccomyxa subellipsoidea (strain C-169) TaxID=574566 RepID=I0YNF0_COCSC|nr:hypothetical protein COCSUDRAFT_58156 [Coccomyxa subellipsoidea C-169]EIE19919.1 hypothetical protein COCSUDRAFT_58156 [Coccomyxa subellipsoidea C-169]|eukprot:XP_005644463.1 hypothetical protein COCSUDRAFT_58156 [Coccomyxa subellipsoidea C-169]
MEVAIETVSFTTSVEGTTPAIAAAASQPDTLALAAQCPFIQQIVVLTDDAQAVSNTLAPFMALANSTTAPRMFHHRARMTVDGEASPRATVAVDMPKTPGSSEPLHIPVGGLESPAIGKEPVGAEGGKPQQEESTEEAREEIVESWKPKPEQKPEAAIEGDGAGQQAAKEEASPEASAQAQPA